MTYETAASHIPDGRIAATCRITMPGYATTWHEHDEFMFLLPRRGMLTLKTERSLRARRIAANSLAVVGPKLSHETAGNSGEHCHVALYVQKDFVSFCANKAAGRKIDRHALSFCTPTPSLFAALSLQSQFDAASSARPTAVGHDASGGDLPRYRRELIDRLVASACVEAALRAEENGACDRLSPDDLVARIKSFIDTTLEQPLDLDTVAHAAGVSRRHATRIFRQETGHSIGGYHGHQRAMRAAAMLEVPGTSVLSAALAVGLESPSYLARLFKKHAMPLPRTFKLPRGR